jgi:drug/metabolite transporter (DMT)-like permease
MSDTVRPGAGSLQKSSVLGLFAAIFATFSWSLNFIAPYLMAGYTAFDAIVSRYLFCGLLGLAILWSHRRSLASIGLQDALVAAALGILGYAGYVTCIMMGVIYAGPIIPAAIVGTVPVIVSLIGNSTTKAVSWRQLAFPLLLIRWALPQSMSCRLSRCRPRVERRC